MGYAGATEPTRPRGEVGAAQAGTWKDDLPKSQEKAKRKKADDDGSEIRNSARKARQPAFLWASVGDTSVVKYTWKDAAGSIGSSKRVRLNPDTTLRMAQKQSIIRHDDVERQSIKKYNRDLIQILARRRIVKFSKAGSLGHGDRPYIEPNDMPTNLRKPKLVTEHLKAAAIEMLALAAEIETEDS
ncbi:hypothetical protein NM208_g13325 [Fusarium decemcellulare]|uniref:Uncharacterized protein n=1 Tax=Fusarium decemcellulare TaxID=57161 RepID=A0ACC1RNU2_9HYPO|nr:hypothetical protein NM208_g13325 [Fusarium decemcellulare]